jgi:hypothetical protein
LSFMVNELCSTQYQTGFLFLSAHTCEQWAASCNQHCDSHTQNCVVHNRWGVIFTAPVVFLFFSRKRRHLSEQAIRSSLTVSQEQSFLCVFCAPVRAYLIAHQAAFAGNLLKSSRYCTERDSNQTTRLPEKN